MQKHSVMLFSKKNGMGRAYATVVNLSIAQRITTIPHWETFQFESTNVKRVKLILGIKQRSQKKTLKNDELHLPIQIGHLCP